MKHNPDAEYEPEQEAERKIDREQRREDSYSDETLEQEAEQRKDKPTSQMPDLFPGYRVTKLEEEPGVIGYAYEVVGPKRTWRLMRNRKNTTLLFPIPMPIGRVFAIRGYQWFTDKDGELKPLSGVVNVGH